MDPVGFIGPPKRRGRALLQFPSADLAHPAGRRQAGLLLRHAALGVLALGDVDVQGVETEHLMVADVRQVFALPMPCDAVRIGVALIEELPPARERRRHSSVSAFAGRSREHLVPVRSHERPGAGLESCAIGAVRKPADAFGVPVGDHRGDAVRNLPQTFLTRPRFCLLRGRVRLQMRIEHRRDARDGEERDRNQSDHHRQPEIVDRLSAETERARD